MKKIGFPFVAVVMFMLFGTTVVSAHDHKTSTHKKGLDFIENKGQWGHDIRYKAEIPGGVFFMTPKGFVYNFINIKDLAVFSETLENGDKPKHNGIHMHAYKVNFIGGNANGEIASKGLVKRSYYQNYFIGNNPDKWAGHVGLFGKAKLNNIYDGIDVLVYSNSGSRGASLKYDFVVGAGVSASQIKLSFDGVTPTLSEEGDLVIQTSVNKIVEQAPYSYQEINGKKIPVASEYKLADGVLSFSFPNGYNQAYPLIIDPNLIFATYSGGTSSTFFAHSTTYDPAGNTYATGLSQGAGWPVTTGAYMTTSPGTNSVSLNVYTSLGNALIYSTYFGANTGSTEPNTLRVGPLGNLVIAGSTNTSNLPVTTGAYQPTNSGGNDIYVSKLSADGSTLLASTYVGGSSNDACRVGLTSSYVGLGSSGNPRNPVEVVFDSLGNVWVTSNSTSTNFPVTNNAFQSTNAGNADAVIFKLDQSFSTLMYSTYLGGNNWDGGIGLEFDPDGHLVSVGMTESANFPTTTGVLNENAFGSEDGYVVRFDTATGNLMAATYLGTTADDDAERVDFDGSGNVYVSGRSLGGTYPVSTGSWSSPNGNIYVQKLSPDLSTSLKSTTVATSSSSSVVTTGFMVDLCGNVVIGTLQSAGSQPNMELTPNAFQTGASPFYLAIINQYFDQLVFGSYFGTTSDHFHPAVARLDYRGVYYQSVCSTSGTFPTTNGSFSKNKMNGTTNDVVTFKFDFQPNAVEANIDNILSPSSNDSGCAPYTLNLTADSSTSPYSINFTWDPGDGSPLIAGPTFVHTYNTPGTYTIICHANSDSACITDDWDSFRVTVLEITKPDIIASADTLLCNGEETLDLHVNILNPTPNNSIEWWPTGSIISGGTNDTVTVNPFGSPVFYVRVRDSIQNICGFYTDDTVNVNVFPRGLDILTNDTTVCVGSQIQVSAVSSPGYTFNWSPATGVNDATALSPIITANQTINYTLTAHHPGCLDTAQTLKITVEQYPVVDLGDDIDICKWEEVTLSSNVVPFRNDYTYQWTPTEELIGTQSPNTHFVADSSDMYYLEVKTPVGCSGMDSIYVTVFQGNFGAFPKDTGYCLPGQAQLWASGGVSYQWTPSDGLDNDAIATPIANPLRSTNYTVYVEDIHGCTDTGDVFIDVYPSAVISLPDSISVYPGEGYHLEPSTNCTYFNWFPTNGINSTQVSDPIFNPAVRTRYFVTATTAYGCELTDSIDVLVKGTVLNIPNAFTPGVGVNGTFKISKKGIANLIDFSIYNRWGNKIFSTTDINEGWDGTYKGKAQPTGVYIYTLQAVTDSGEKFVQRGDVTLIR